MLALFTLLTETRMGGENNKKDMQTQLWQVEDALIGHPNTNL